jgi:hypothetical protein
VLEAVYGGGRSGDMRVFGFEAAQCATVALINVLNAGEVEFAQRAAALGLPAGARGNSFVLDFDAACVEAIGTTARVLVEGRGRIELETWRPERVLAGGYAGYAAALAAAADAPARRRASGGASSPSLQERAAAGGGAGDDAPSGPPPSLEDTMIVLLFKLHSALAFFGNAAHAEILRRRAVVESLLVGSSGGGSAPAPGAAPMCLLALIRVPSGASFPIDLPPNPSLATAVGVASTALRTAVVFAGISTEQVWASRVAEVPCAEDGERGFFFFVFLKNCFFSPAHFLKKTHMSFDSSTPAGLGGCSSWMPSPCRSRMRRSRRQGPARADLICSSAARSAPPSVRRSGCSPRATTRSSSRPAPPRRRRSRRR